MLVLITAFSCLSSFLFGWDLGLMGGALLYIKDEFNVSEGLAELIVAAAKLGAVFGTFLGGGLMLHYGRKRAIALDSLFFIVGPLIMATAWGVVGLIIGRFIVGIGIGISAVVVPAYLGEVAPAKARGRVVELYEVMLCLGMLTSSLVDAALDDVKGNWRWMVAAPAFPALLMSVAVYMLPESPRWLVVRGRLDDALAVIHRVHTNQLLPVGAQWSTAEVEHELMELWSSVERDKDAAAQRAHDLEITRQRRQLLKGQSNTQQGAGNGDGNGYLASAFAAAASGGGGNGGGGAEHELARLNPGGGDSAAPSAAWPPPRPPPASPFLDSQDSGGVGGGGGAGNSGGGKGSRPSSRASSNAADILPPVDDSVVVGIPPRLPRIRTRSNDRLYAMADESAGAAGTAAGYSSSAASSATGHAGIQPQRPPPPPPPPHQLPPMNSSLVSVPLSSTLPLPRENYEPQGFWATFWAMLKDIIAVAQGPERSAFMMVLVLAFFNQAFASTAIINYAPLVLQHAGVESEATASFFTSLIGASKLAGVVIAFFVIDSIGRRPLLIWGSLGCAVSLSVLVPADWLDSHTLLIVGMCCFIFSFSISWAGVFWVLLSESFSMGAKSPAASAATAILFLTGAAADMLFLSFHSWMGPMTFFMYACIAAAAAVYVVVAVPETKGRTLQEVQDMLAGKSLRQNSLMEGEGNSSLEYGNNMQQRGWRLWRRHSRLP